MKTAVAIIQRDLTERRFIFGAAAVFSLIPFAALLIPSMRGDVHASVAVVANVLAVTFIAAVTIGVGATMIGSDLSAGRLSFYLSKPIPAPALWYGKLAAALITIYASLAIVAAPALLYAFSSGGGVWSERRAVLTTIAIVAPLFLLVAHTFSTMLRTRSAILIADAIALAIAIAGIQAATAPLADADAIRLLSVVRTTLTCAFAAILVLAGAWHLGRGRTDRRANHVALSKFLWSASAFVVAMLGIFVLWVGSATPAALRETGSYAAPSGPWTVIGGTMPSRLDYTSAFLIDAQTGRYVRLPLRDANGLTFSRDGKTAAWAHGSGRYSNEREIWTRRLVPLGPVRKTGIRTSQFGLLALADDGTRVAIAGGNLVNVVDVETGRSLASAHIPSRDRDVSLFFVTPDSLRIYISPASSPHPDKEIAVSIFELDVRNRTLRQTGAFRGTGLWISFAVSSDAARAIVDVSASRQGNSQLCEADARTGQCFGPATVKGIGSDFAELSDGSIVEGWSHQNTFSLFHGVDRVDVRSNGFAYLVATSGMKAIVASEIGTTGAWNTVIIDVANRRVERVVANFKVSLRRKYWRGRDPRIAPATDHVFTGIDANGHLARLDINTGVITPVPY